MLNSKELVWRLLLTGGGLAFLVGAGLHPRADSPADMMADPSWVPAHLTVLIGVLLQLGGLIAYRNARQLSGGAAKWLKLVLFGTALLSVEMAVHTIAYVDAEAARQYNTILEAALAFGGVVLSIHLWLSLVAYTIYGVTLVGFILTNQKAHAIGSPWIGWIGVIGGVSQASVMPLIMFSPLEGTGKLFPIAALTMSLWFVLAGLWPVRRSEEPTRATAEAAPEASLPEDQPSEAIVS
jgi:hypothetical protein